MSEINRIIGWTIFAVLIWIGGTLGAASLSIWIMKRLGRDKKVKP